MRVAITFSEHHDGHAQQGHVERPARLHAIRKLLAEDGILDSTSTLPSCLAPVEAVTLVHPFDYYERLKTAVEAGGARLDPDTYAKPDSLKIALQGLGGLLAITDKVLEGAYDNGFAIIRPPGHHARPDTAMGFCLFANVAIATEWAKKHHGIQKVLIVDFDVHHGNGTQEIFYEDLNVMYMSTHQRPLYPGTGALEETGAGSARGSTINIPLPAQTGDEDYLKVFKKILTPIALEFNPELIFVSAGYDAHWMDPIGGMNLTVSGFDAIMLEILSWAAQCTNHKLVAALEGGYNTDALAHCVLNSVKLLQSPETKPEDKLGKARRPDAEIDYHLDRLIEFYT